MDSKIEELFKRLLNCESIEDFVPQSRSEAYLKAAILRSGTDDLPYAASRLDALLYDLTDKISDSLYGYKTQEKTVTPTQTEQEIVPDEGYVLSKITVNREPFVKGLADGSIEEVIIPEGTTTIRDYAFYNCSGLKTLVIPESVTYIPYDVISGCYNIEELTIPGVFFENNSSLPSTSYLKKLVLLSGTSIPDNFCNGSSYLEELVLPDTLTSIGSNAFGYCSSIKSIIIPSNVTSIGDYAFEGCESLFEVYNLSGLDITAGSEDYGKIAYYAKVVHTSLDEPSIFQTTDDGFNFIVTENECTLTGYKGSETDVVLPNGYNGRSYCIGESAFSGCSSLTSITIPNRVTSIGNAAFLGCSSLTSITIPNSVTSIGESAFYECSLLTSIVISDAVTSISNFTFYNCYNLTSITIPNSVTSIGNAAFWNCALTNITIPNSVTSIGDNAFQNCYKLLEVYNLSSLTIEKGSTSNGKVGYYALNVYTPDFGEKKTFATDSGYIFYEDGESCYLIGYKGTDKELTLPKNCNGKTYEIYNRAFYYYRSRLTSITIPNSVTSIGGYAFYDCSSLTSITIPNSVTSIGESAFSGCSSLTSVTLPAYMSELSTTRLMFGNCHKLVTVSQIDMRNVTTANSMFHNCKVIENIILKNVKVTLTIGSGTTYGHLLTVDSLLGVIGELIDTGATKTLTVGTANLSKLSNIYVKTITITDEMRAADEFIDSKLPFEVCGSTDDGAMLIKDYVTHKKWKLA